MIYRSAPGLNENDLAIIERADTASRAYSAGQYVSWHGRTGRVKADILQGASLDATLFDYNEDGVLNGIFKQVIIPASSSPSGTNYVPISQYVPDNAFVVSAYCSNQGLIAIPFKNGAKNKWFLTTHGGAYNNNTFVVLYVE